MSFSSHIKSAACVCVRVFVCCDINNLIAVVYLNAAGAPSDGYF